MARQRHQPTTEELRRLYSAENARMTAAILAFLDVLTGEQPPDPKELARRRAEAHEALDAILDLGRELARRGEL